MKHSYFYRVLTVTLVSLMLLAALCLAISAKNTDTLYETMTPIFTAKETNALTGQSGTLGDFTWKVDGGTVPTTHTVGGYTGKAVKIAPGAFRFNDDNNTLSAYDAVLFGGDVCFTAFPGLPVSTDTTTSSDASSKNFQPQSLLTWYGMASTGTTYFDGIRIDSEGNLYFSGAGTALGVKLELNTWYNLKVLYSSQNKAEIWINGERIATMNCNYRTTSLQVRFFDATYKFTAYVKSAELSTSKDTYYLGTVKEHSSDFISYQTSIPEANGRFNLRILSGINSLDYQSFGYRVLLLEKDAEPIELEGTDTLAYSSVRAGTDLYSVKDHFGYEYACFATITGLDVNKEYFELVVFPYTLSLDDEKIYGNAISLTYAGETDANGYPVLNVVGDNEYTEFKVTDDTYIYRTWEGAPFGSTPTLLVQNVSTDIGGSYRAAYFKFTIPAEDAAKLSSVTAAYLRIHSSGLEANAERVARDLCVYEAPTNWDEDTLAYKTFYPYGNSFIPSGQGNGIGDPIATVPVAEYTSATFFAVDILDHIKAQTKNADGSITVAFCVTHPNNLGSDTRVVYLDAKENGDSVAANIRFEHSLYGRSFSNLKANNKGYEPLAYAEKLVDEWFGTETTEGLYDKIYPKDADGNLLTYDIDALSPNGYGATTATGDFQKPIQWEEGFLWRRTDNIGTYSDTGEPNWKLKSSEWQTDRFARTLSTLGISVSNAYLTSGYATTATHDVYGGITNAGFTGKATGYFHTEYIGGRTYIIDPLGYPYFATSINSLSYGENTNLQDYSASVYGIEENFYKEMSAELMDMGIYATFASDPDVILGVDNGLSTTVPINGVSAYMADLGRSQITEGQFPHNNTINVFDPDFVTTTYEKNAKFITDGGYATNPRVLGYTADNELPSSKIILECYLTIDPNVPDNAFSYHTAWEWFARRTGNANPTILDYYNYADKATLNSEFLGFIYARNYKTVRGSIEQVDTNHMYMGSRVAGECRYDINYLKAAGYYLDVITTNLYDGLNPDPEVMTNYYRYAGIPFIVTEFYAKAMDAIDANGHMLTNSTGAGFVVMTQQERANYYEHFVLSLLESKACVGWSWYRFRDNDQGLWATTDGKYTDLRMLFVSYGDPTYPVTYADVNGNIYANADLGVTATNWKTALTQTYVGEPMASNQNCNKGIYNANYSTTVAVYTYDASGNNLIGVNSYEVDDSALTEIPTNGTTLTGKDGTKTFTLGTSGTTKTVLTTYKGKYLALSDSIQKISNNIMGIVNYLDNDQHIQK